MSRSSLMIKRIMDVIGAGLLLVLLSPLIIATAILVAVRLGRPILFTQQRPGRHGLPFTIYKFRSLTDDCDAHGELLPDHLRLTPFGRWLRSTSLDELPELYNVVRGDMSLVGPRPLLMEYLPYYTSQEARRHEVRPGLTGWAQVNGRNAISWKERLELDVWYVDNRSLALDLKTLWLTARNVMTREGVTPAESEIMPRFRGSGGPHSASGGAGAAERS